MNSAVEFGWRFFKGLIFVLLVFVALLYFGWWFLFSPSWPAVDEPAQLQHDATQLLQSPYEDGETPRASWPHSVTSLHPRSVYITRGSNLSEQHMVIMIRSGGMSKISAGYNVWPETKHSPGRIEKYEIEHE